MTNNPRPIRRLFLDIEVSPNIGLFWRTGQKVSIGPDAIVKERSIICACWSWDDEKEIHSAQWDRNQSDRELLSTMLDVMEEADEVIAHFGAFFDIPWLRTRIIYHGLNPMPLFKVVDTKAWASKYFYFNSNKLDYIAKLLGSDGKIKTEWEWWVKILMQNDRLYLKKMVDYNKKDVIELRFVWKKLQPHCPVHVHAGVVAGGDRWSCPRTGSENVRLSKRRVTASGSVIFQMQNNEDGSYYSISQSAFDRYNEHKLQKVRGPAKKRHSQG